MSQFKNWPISNSEYIMPAEVADIVHQHVMSGTCSLRCIYYQRYRQDNAALSALLQLRLLAERYYEAAGFRQ